MRWLKRILFVGMVAAIGRAVIANREDLSRYFKMRKM